MKYRKKNKKKNKTECNFRMKKYNFLLINNSTDKILHESNINLKLLFNLKLSVDKQWQKESSKS